MKITFVTVGKFKSQDFESLFSRYAKLITKFSSFEHIEIKKSTDEAILDFLEKRSRFYLTVLDEKGKLFKSREFASHVEKIKDGSHSEWIILCGFEHGFSKAITSKAQLLLSLSPLTFPHELAAVVAVEQIFRGFSILSNHPYHND